MILLDTNVASDGLRPRPDPNVVVWLDRQNTAELFLCTPVVAELHYGVQLLPAGTRRGKLERAISDLLTAFENRILPFDSTAAFEYARFVAHRDHLGRTTGTMDAIIAGIALTHGAVVATRDTRGFDDFELKLINPFDIAISP